MRKTTGKVLADSYLTVLAVPAASVQSHIPAQVDPPRLHETLLAIRILHANAQDGGHQPATQVQGVAQLKLHPQLVQNIQFKRKVLSEVHLRHVLKAHSQNKH